ncbi:UbiD family decarboxylase [Podospora appendiculata]|uniref:UbiD family decarboxylase n=1 Tax=Podospora appendiculata TaxID=314037 RepID=A0AAE0X120_9PEZI|nr:UbiD family decarboxylase [Podospora appendiculata]
MALTVLTDDQIRILLENLTVDELESFRNDLKTALHEYSTGTQVPSQGAIHQPERTSLHNAETGATTLFMPSSSPAGHGVKVITLSSAKYQDNPETVIKPTGAITLFAPQGTVLGILHASTLTAFRTALASVCLVHKRDSIRELTVFGCGEQAYWHVRLTLLLRGSTVRHVNFVNRSFSQSCKAILRRLYNVPGALKAREGWTECTFGVLTPGYGDYGRLLREQVQAADVIFCCTPSTVPLFDAEYLTDHEARRKGRLIVAIGSYTPEMREIPVELIKQATRIHEKGHRHFHKHAQEGGVVVVDTLDGALKEAGELIEAGLEPKQLVELGELVMLHTLTQLERDDEDEDLPETPSITNASDLMERLDINSSTSSLGGIRSAMSSVFGGSDKRGSTASDSSSRTTSPSRLRPKFHIRTSSRGSVDISPPSHHSKKKHEDAEHLAKWLQTGNVIYKSVGLGLMDLTVGLHLIQFAKDRGIVSHLEGF